MTAPAPFDRIAAAYDALWTGTENGRAQRRIVWRAIDSLFKPGDEILDIGCGTGEDAAHLVARGVAVHAIDASLAMVARASARGVAAQVGKAEDLVGQVGNLRRVGNPPWPISNRPQDAILPYLPAHLAKKASDANSSSSRDSA